MALTAGTCLGPYQIRDQIGAGGMGEVYRATDTRLDRTVAIKVLPEHLAGRADLRERFEREAKAVSSLNHPIRTYDVSADGPFLEMTESQNEPEPATEINIILNWFEELRERVPVP